jgi:TolA-binding protein
MRALSVSLLLMLALPALAQDDPPADAEKPAEGEGEGEEKPAEPAPPPPKPEPPPPPAEEMDDSTGQARLRHLSELVKRFEEEAEDYRREVMRIAERKYTERRARIENNYAQALKPIIEAERRNRLDAIAVFERFLERYPNNRKFTPDAIFRLAELYFEKYDDDHQQAMSLFRDNYGKWQDAGAEGDPPEEPLPKFPRTVELYQDLIQRFPDYRLIDGAYYLLGYTQRTQGDEEDGMRTWMALVDRFPESRFYAEVWFRIGDYRFDEEQWEPAIAAFGHVVPMKDSPFYDKALYKLAWTYYLVNRFDDSVERFFELLDYSYAKREAEGAQDEEFGGSVLEEESLQYVAISFADDNWPRSNEFKTLISGRSFDDELADVEIDYVRFALDYFTRTGKKPYEREVLARLGDILFKQSKNKQAILALKEAISRDPLHRSAPKLQDLVVQAYERERDFDAASAERDILIASYSEDTAWFNKHIGDGEARREAKTLAKNSLYKAAIYYHQQANKYFEDNKQDLGVKAFEAAAASYGQYLERYPHDKEAYELTFYLGETYYYSLQFRKAATIYAKVRDSSQGTKYRDESALNVVYALDKVLQAEVKSGRLADKDPFKVTSGDEKKLLPKTEIDPLRKEYIGAIDKLLEIGPSDKVAANFGYTAGAIYYSHGQYDEAIKRFETVVEKYPSAEAAKFSGNLILDYLLAKEDWAEAAKVAARFKTQLKAADPSEIAKIEGGAKFQLARKTLEDGDKALKEGRVAEGIAMLEEGANTYLALLEEDPKREFADRMLYNAALSLEKARRPAKAAGLYERLYKDYPDSTFAAQAMFNVASKSELAFDFDKAIKTYRGLVKKYPESDLRADAQINAALALEGQQRYREAARELERFAAMFPDRPEAADVFFRAAIVHKKRGAPGDEIGTLRKFIRKYKKDRAQAPRVVEAHVRIGEVNGELAKKASGRKRRNLDKASKDSYKAAVAAYNRAPGSATGAYFAAKAAFELAERDWRVYEGMKIKGNKGKTQGKELVAKSEKLTQVEATYKSVITTYKQAEWSLASLYRLGALYDNLQATIYAAPCPRDIKRIDPLACDEYRNVLEDKAFAVEEKAVEAYRTAYERARALKLNNDWTRRTLEALNRLRPEFAIDKEPLGEAGTGEVYNLGYVLPDGGARMVGGGSDK